jgi:hypothetical protein
MNKDERTHFENLIKLLLDENKALASLLRNHELRMTKQLKLVEGKLDSYCHQLYRHSFYGGLLWRIEVVRKWFNEKALFRSMKTVKKLQDA